LRHTTLTWYISIINFGDLPKIQSNIKRFENQINGFSGSFIPEMIAIGEVGQGFSDSDTIAFVQKDMAIGRGGQK